MTPEDSLAGCAHVASPRRDSGAAKQRVALTHYAGGTLQAIADAWSPNGTQVLFHREALSGSSTEVGGFYIAILKPTLTGYGTHIRRFTHVVLRYDARAAWGRSPG
jgi:hypothetical protein